MNRFELSKILFSRIEILGNTSFDILWPQKVKKRKVKGQTETFTAENACWKFDEQSTRYGCEHFLVENPKVFTLFQVYFETSENPDSGPHQISAELHCARDNSASCLAAWTLPVWLG